MIRIFHVSDLHFVEKRADNMDERRLLDDIGGRFNPENDYLAVTGDLTDDPDERQMEEAVAALRRFEGRLLIVPGNHDYLFMGNFNYHAAYARRFDDHVLRPLGLERSFLNKIPAVDVLDDGAGVKVLAIGLNSVTLTHSGDDWAIGEIGEAQIRRLVAHLEDPKYADHWRFVYMHHRPEHTGIGNPWMKLVDHAELLTAVRHRAHVLAFGHSGGTATRAEHKLRIEQLGMRRPVDGWPYFLNANSSVAQRKWFEVTFEAPPGGGISPTVALCSVR